MIQASSLATHLRHAPYLARAFAPSICIAFVIALALHFLTEIEKCKAGIEFTEKSLLRLGIALLGARITFDQLAALGFGPLVLVLVCICATIAFGLIASRLLGRSLSLGMLTGGSAALAISAVLSRTASLERDTLFTVISVTTLSTIAMIVYPIIFANLGFSDQDIGILIGATIHDVAQVIGAGYAVSEEAGDIASYVKLLCVAMLPVVVILLGIVVRRTSGGWWWRHALAFVHAWPCRVSRDEQPWSDPRACQIVDGRRLALVADCHDCYAWCQDTNGRDVPPWSAPFDSGGCPDLVSHRVRDHASGCDLSVLYFRQEVPCQTKSIPLIRSLSFI